MRHRRLFAALALIVACTKDSSDDIAASAEHATEKGLLGLVPAVAFGEQVGGAIRGRQLDVWAIDLKGGDKITVVEIVTSGGLKPDAQLFLGSTTKLSSSSYTAEPAKLTKSYTVEVTGRYFVAVRAFEGQGEGDYALTVSCNGGPCKGEPVIDTLDDDQAGECISLARRCSFKNMAVYNGNVGAVRARQLFEDCLEGLSLEDEGLSCATACDEAERKPVCEGLIGLLPFYADQSAGCLAELEECMDVCSDDANGGVVNGAEDICLLNGLNGTCDGFARGHADCGGSYVDDSNEECHAFCESTFGAWNDDLDTICVEQCD